MRELVGQGRELDAGAVREPSLFLPLVAIWLLMLVTFSMPGRQGPSGISDLDAIALAKVGCRGGLLLVLGLMSLLLFRHPNYGRVLWCFWPFMAYGAWAVLSTIWSPLPALSLGQASGLVVQLMMAAVIGVLAGGTRRTSTVLCHLSLALFLISLSLLGVDMVNREFSGLHRISQSEDGSVGLMHPTSAGATASLGVAVLVAARLLWGWNWTRRLLWPAIAVHGTVLLIAASRMALAALVGVLAVMFCMFAHRRAVAALLAGVSLVGTLYLAIDPGLQLGDRLSERVTSYATRGESSELLLSLTGRTDLWDLIFQSFLESPIRGHGYFVTSQTGAFYVWQSESNHSAHNVILQVLVSTGLVGCVIFLYALARPIWLVRCGLFGEAASRKLAVFASLLGVWYFGWSMLCESFMGSIQPESVVFFTMLGLVAGNIPSLAAVPLAREWRREPLEPVVQT